MAEPEVPADGEDENEDRPPGDPRAAQDDLIIECLAAGMSYPQAGEIAGCTARTISRRMANRDFARRVSRRRGERVQAIAGQLTALAEDAVTTVREVLASADRDADRLRAAHMVLTLLGRFRADTDLEDRLNELEHHLGDPTGQTDGDQEERSP